MSDYQKFMAWLEKTYPTHARAYSGDPVIQSAFFAGMAATDGAHKRMFEAACVDLGRINECLGLDPDYGGAEPIIEAIKELRASAEQWQKLATALPPEKKNQSFNEAHPRNPDAKCSCEHWQACIDCHPTYIESAIRGDV